LPLVDNIDNQQIPETHSKKRYNFRGTTILIAEDEETNYDLIKTILVNTSAKIVWAKNGKQAVSFIQKNRNIKNCIVLMDIKMPEMDGIAAQKRIHEINNTIPVIAVTAYAQSSDRSKLLRNKFDAYISKPIYPPKLLHLIESFAKSGS
jgi:CheY-like chemotaxis protein